MASLTEKAGFLTLSNLLQRISVIFSGIIVVRLLSTTELGTFRQVNLIFSTCSMCLLIGIPSSLYYFLPRVKNVKKKGVIVQTLLNLSFIGAFSSITLYFIAPTISDFFNNKNLSSLIILYSPYLIFALPSATYFTVMMCLKKIKLAAIGSFIITLSQILATILPIVFGLSLKLVFTTMLVTSIIVGSLFIYLSIKLSPKGPVCPESGFTKKQIKFSLPIGISQLITITGREIDKIFISIFFSIKEFAVFSVGAIELPITSLIAPGINAVLLPEFSVWFKENNKIKILETWSESRRKLCLITFPIIFFFFCVSEEFLILLYTDTYASAVPIFQIYLLIPFVINFNSSVILHAKGKTTLLLYATLINIITNIALNYILIRSIGQIGPCIATVVALIVHSSVITLYICKELGVKPQNLFPIYEFLRIIIACIIAGIVVFFLKISNIISENIVFFIIAGFSYFIVLTCCYCLFVLKKEDHEFFSKYLSKFFILNRINNFLIKKGRIV